jgi:hypothetical protein
MNTWTPERGVLRYRPRLGAAARPLQPDEPAFPWFVLPVLGVGFALFFAGLALIGADWRAWEAAVVAVGFGLIAAAFAVLVRRFL